jgi:hypothetical protein
LDFIAVNPPPQICLKPQIHAGHESVDLKKHSLDAGASLSERYFTAEESDLQDPRGVNLDIFRNSCNIENLLRLLL